MIVNRAVTGLSVGLIAAAVAPLSAQGWAQPKCDLPTRHFLVNSGVLYLRNASTTKYEEQKQKDLRDAERVLTQAVTTGGQQENPAAWYYLGRRYVIINDLRGADTAFARAQALQPACKDDISSWRQYLWRTPFNEGVRAYQAGITDSAIHFFKQANIVFQDPRGMMALASLYANTGQTDSAAAYYGATAALSTASDTATQRVRREAMFNRGAVYNQARRWEESKATFTEYVAAFPDDVQALAGLATAYAQLGNKDSALHIYEKVLAASESAEPRHLFAAGVAMFNAAPPEPDSAAIARRCVDAQPRASRTQAQTRAWGTTCATTARDSMRAHRADAAKYYRGAASAFEAGLARNVGFRDAVFNLVNTLYKLQDTTRLLAAAQQLYGIDPYNRNVVRLLAAAWQMRGKPDSTLRYLALADSIPVDVTITNFTPSDQGASLIGLATNSHDAPSAQLTLTVEFLDEKGAVVATQTAEIPSLAAGGSQQIDVRAIATGIMAWRYRGG